LAISRAIIEKFGGWLILESGRDESARFAIYLPAAAAQPATSEKIAAAQPLALSGRGRILLMDDDPAVGEVGAELLEFLGYEAELAADGRQALEIYQKAKQQGEPFTAVILDLIIPAGMGGRETMELLRKFDPEVKAIVSSGYARDLVLENFKDYGFAASLPKPYSVEQLGQVLHSILAKEKVS
jgi:two-component system, cell cycle sensor histidine kinase and response regulator CckA